MSMCKPLLPRSSAGLYRMGLMTLSLMTLGLMTLGLILGLVLLALGIASGAEARERYFLLASTTSLENSGFLDHIKRHVLADTGLNMRVIVSGTGQALQSGERGDVDVVFVHHPDSEKAFLEKGFASRRLSIMRNDFLLVGPNHAPNHETDFNVSSIQDALREIQRREAVFLSRGDDSGTHRKEQELWRSAGLSPWENTRSSFRSPSGAAEVSVDAWYYEGGVGMAQLLRAADELGAYTLVDRATWEKFRPTLNLHPVYEVTEGEATDGKVTDGEVTDGQDDDAGMINVYSVLMINPRRHAHVRSQAVRRFMDWLESPRGQRAIFSFRVHDRQVFHPIHKPE